MRLVMVWWWLGLVGLAAGLRCYEAEGLSLRPMKLHETECDESAVCCGRVHDPERGLYWRTCVADQTLCEEKRQCAEGRLELRARFGLSHVNVSGLYEEEWYSVDGTVCTCTGQAKDGTPCNRAAPTTAASRLPVSLLLPLLAPLLLPFPV